MRWFQIKMRLVAGLCPDPLGELTVLSQTPYLDSRGPVSGGMCPIFFRCGDRSRPYIPWFTYWVKLWHNLWQSPNSCIYVFQSDCEGATQTLAPGWQTPSRRPTSLIWKHISNGANLRLPLDTQNIIGHSASGGKALWTPPGSTPTPWPSPRLLL